MGPAKRLFSQGVSCLAVLPSGDLLAGAGDGHIAKLGIRDFELKARGELMGAPTSISLAGDSAHFFCGTSQSNIYWVDCSKLQPELRSTCHSSRINDVAFPRNYSEVFATCALSDIRVWNCKNRAELLRIQVPNLECHCLAFSEDGGTILSGWSDGRLRAFLPQSGKLRFVINDAHVHGVTAVCPYSEAGRVISGGSQGEVRIWRLGKTTQTMEASMKEHRGRVWSIQLTRDNCQAVSSSSDGSCIIWDLHSHSRLLCLFESTVFRQVLFHPEETQLLTAGSDRKITYWERSDAQALRTLVGEGKEVNALDITKAGLHFLSAGEDKTVRLWDYI